MGFAEALFYILPGSFVVGGVFGVVRTLRRSSRISRAWRHGRTAEARCLRMYTTTSGGGRDTSVTTTLHQVYEFTTAEGRVVRFEETGRRPTVLEGDFVIVHYLPEEPESATAHAPSQGKLAAETLSALAFFGVFIAFSVAFMIGAHSAFGEAGDLLP